MRKENRHNLKTMGNEKKYITKQRNWPEKMKQGELAIVILYQHNKGEIQGDSGTFHSAMGSMARPEASSKSSNIKANSSCSKNPLAGRKGQKPSSRGSMNYYLATQSVV